jgi:hypothetical protein
MHLDSESISQVLEMIFNLKSDAGEKKIYIEALNKLTSRDSNNKLAQIPVFYVE